MRDINSRPKQSIHSYIILFIVVVSSLILRGLYRYLSTVPYPGTGTRSYGRSTRARVDLDLASVR